MYNKNLFNNSKFSFFFIEPNCVNYTVGSYSSLSVCPSVCQHLWNLCFAPLLPYGATLCTIKLCCAPPTCIHVAQGGPSFFFEKSKTNVQNCLLKNQVPLLHHGAQRRWMVHNQLCAVAVVHNVASTNPDTHTDTIKHSSSSCYAVVKKKLDPFIICWIREMSALYFRRSLNMLLLCNLDFEPWITF